jgi:hypothetical protein
MFVTHHIKLGVKSYWTHGLWNISFQYYASAKMFVTHHIKLGVKSHLGYLELCTPAYSLASFWYQSHLCIIIAFSSWNFVCGLRTTRGRFLSKTSDTPNPKWLPGGRQRTYFPLWFPSNNSRTLAPIYLNFLWVEEGSFRKPVLPKIQGARWTSWILYSGTVMQEQDCQINL